MDTKAIQAAIDAAADAGGGRLYLHNGTFLSGPLRLKSNVTLHIETGAVLLGSPGLRIIRRSLRPTLLALLTSTPAEA